MVRLVLFVVMLQYLDGLQCSSRLLLVEVCVSFICVELICVVELWLLLVCMSEVGSELLAGCSALCMHL